MKFYAYRGIDELGIIKEEGGLFYKGVSYSDGSIRFYQIPYPPSEVVELQDIPLDSNNSLEKIDKLKIHKDVSSILAKKYTGYILKTELSLSNSLTLTVILKKHEPSLLWEKGREISDYVDDELEKIGYPSQNNFSVHVVTQDMWDSRRY